MTTEYSTSNLSVAAYLLTREFEIVRVDERGGTVFFVFADPQGIAKQVLNEYYGNGTVSVRAFVAALKICRDRMFEVRRSMQYQGKETKNDHVQQLLGK